MGKHFDAPDHLYDPAMAWGHPWLVKSMYELYVFSGWIRCLNWSMAQWGTQVTYKCAVVLASSEWKTYFAFWEIIRRLSTVFLRCHTRNKGSSRLYSWMGTLQCLNYFYHHNYDFTKKALTYGNMHPRIKELCRNFQNTDYSVGVDGGGLQIRETWNEIWVLTI